MGMTLTNMGRRIMLSRAFTDDEEYSVPCKFKVGSFYTEDASVNPEETDLNNPVEIKNGEYLKDIMEGYPKINISNMEVTYRFFLDNDEANDSYGINEVGLFDEGGRIYSIARLPFISGIRKNETIQLSFIQKDRFKIEEL